MPPVRLLNDYVAMTEANTFWTWVGRSGKRIAISLVGGALITAGLVLIIFPGPWTIPLIIAGLAVLGTEYAWARRALKETKDQAGRMRDRLRRKKK